MIVVGDERIYIADGAVIKLFDKAEFNFIKTIGRQGPGEFQDFAIPQILPENLLVSTANKIVYFSPDGEFIKERKHAVFGYGIKAVGRNYLGFAWRFREDYVAYILYDSAFDPVKELHRGKAIIHPNRRREFFEIHFYDTHQNKIVVARREGFAVDIFDAEGSLLHSLTHDVKPVAFTNKDKEKVLIYWKDERGYEQWQIDRLLARTDFPDFFPKIQTCRLADGKIYVITYTREGNKNECLIFSLSGDFIKATYFPLKMLAPNLASPFTIHGNRLYQLMFNYEDEAWVLHVNQIE